MKLRPHHILDIISDYGKGTSFSPHPYGHALHTVSEALTEAPSMEITLVVGADAICAPCMHLTGDGQCKDIAKHEPPEPKQAYNDRLDNALLALLNRQPGTTESLQSFLNAVDKRFEDVVQLCTHPTECVDSRRSGLRAGIQRLA